MSSIKKFLTVLGSFSLGITSATIVAACAPKPATLTILLVPSRNPDQLNATTKRLGELIQAQLAVNGINEQVRVRTALDYNIAARSIRSGTAAVAYLPMTNYYLNSIQENRNTMHQLFQAARLGLKIEYQQANNDENLMNEQGSLATIKDDEINMFNIVKNYGPMTDRTKIDYIKESRATYYRGYQFITKKTLNNYYNRAMQSPNQELKQAWKTIIKPIEEGKAIFNSEVEGNFQNVTAYWKVVWNIFENSARDKGIGLSSQTSSAAGRVSPISIMLQAWIRANNKNEQNPDDIKEAQSAVIRLISNNTVDVANYGSRMLPELLIGRIKTGASFSGTRIQTVESAEINVQIALDEISVFAVSHGLINDGAVYSTRYFKRNFAKLKALQKTFIDLINDNEEAKKIFIDNYSHNAYVASPIDDLAKMAEYENKIKNAQENIISKHAQNISDALATA